MYKLETCVAETQAIPEPISMMVSCLLGDTAMKEKTVLLFGASMMLISTTLGACTPNPIVSYVGGEKKEAGITYPTPFAQGTEHGLLAELEGEYVLSPNACSDSPLERVIIADRIVTDQSGYLENAEFRIDRLEKWTVETDGGAAAGRPLAAYFVYTLLADGSISLVALSEVSIDDFRLVTSNLGLESQSEKEINRPPLLLTRTVFDRPPTLEEINTKLNSVAPGDSIVLEACP